MAECSYSHNILLHNMFHIPDIKHWLYIICVFGITCSLACPSSARYSSKCRVLGSTLCLPDFNSFFKKSIKIKQFIIKMSCWESNMKHLGERDSPQVILLQRLIDHNFTFLIYIYIICIIVAILLSTAPALTPP